MAYEMNIRGTQDKVKVRSPWAAALLPIITLGIYHLVWWYRINREMSDYGKAKGFDLGQNPTNSVLALFPGGPDHHPGADHLLARDQAGPGRLERRRPGAAQRLDRDHPLPDHLAGPLGLHPGRAQQGLGGRGRPGPGRGAAAASGRDATPPPLEPQPADRPQSRRPPRASRRPRGRAAAPAGRAAAELRFLAPAAGRAGS